MKEIFSFRRIKACLRTFFLILIVNNASAQENEPIAVGYSLNPKIGSYTVNESGGFSGGAEMNVIYKKIIYSVDFYHCDEFVIMGPKPSEYFNQLGVMIGKYQGDKFLRFQYQVGLGSFWGLKRTEFINEGSGWFSSESYESKEFSAIGFIAKLGFKIVPLSFLSLGLDLHANINSEKSIVMPMISIEFGKLRNKL